jgi:hypothetical protein
MSIGKRVILALSCLGLVASPATAAIIGVSGDGNILDPNVTPVGMTANFFNDTGDEILVHGWNELQSVELSADITVDITTPGNYFAPFTSDLATLPAGTLVSSHLLYFDPQGSAQREATFTFDGEIIGVIVLSDLPGSDHFLASDFLRHPLSLAPGAHFDNRGIEFGPEVVTFDPGLHELTLLLAASSPGDQIRVITAATPAPIPEPLPSGLVGTGLLLVALWRRR